ncbi:MAG TPA: SRPBCC domain-containing protein [Burkholderiales bacterium]|nr:SRPBCC domain-containing protein [Burkholderiales bacterium]
MAARSSPATKDDPLVLERVFDAPVALVWKALTDVDDIKHWSFDVSGFEPRVGFEFRFTGVGKDGAKKYHQCRITEVVPGKRLAYTWRYEGHAGDSLVTFELLAEGKRTRLRLAHTGLESFAAIPALAKANFEAGWTQIIGSSLKTFVETRRSEKLVGDREIAATRVLDAPRELVWKAWTDPEHIAKWWGPNGFTTTTFSMDLRPGGVWRYVMHGPDGRDYQNKVTYIEVVEPERLVYKLGGADDVEPVTHHVTVTFRDVGGRTRIDTRMVFDSPEIRTHVIETYGAFEGLKQHLSRLEAHLAKA